MLTWAMGTVFGQAKGFDISVVYLAGGVLAAIILFGIIVMLIKCYKKVEQGKALIRTGLGGTKVSFSGMVVLPVIHRVEQMDISVKRVEIERMGGNGLICRDNLRADVKVAFFVQVNKTPQDTLKVAQSLGCMRASDTAALVELFDAKFSEGLKTVGKQFEFVELYTNRQKFKEEILKVIGTDLNGYVLDDAAIDYLEQTSIDKMDPRNILDADGIKKITELTAKQAILSNQITREKEKTIKKQDVETREAVLELERQQAEAEQNQQREIAEITARQQASAYKVQQEERLKAEKARIASDEELGIAEENRQRQIIVAAKNKLRTEAVENERVERDRMLEATERERVVTLAQIEKEKAVEIERRNIQEVIRDRVNVERTVVEQEERIKDTRELAAADRAKRVALTHAEKEGEQEKIKVVKLAEGEKAVAALHAEQQILVAEGKRAASEKEADARKIIADAAASEEAVKGLGEARALEAHAKALEQQGLAEARVIEAKAAAVQKQGLAEAEVARQKYAAEANGIEEKAGAMKLFDSVGKEHEEFKLRLKKDLDVDLACINGQIEVARSQAGVIAEALKKARIDIVGGEAAFFDKIVGAITLGKAVDRAVGSSDVLGDVRHGILGQGGAEGFIVKVRKLVDELGMTSEDVKNLSIAALLTKMTVLARDETMAGTIDALARAAKEVGMAGRSAASVLGMSNN